MNPQQEQYRDQQRATWDKFSAGWKKWDELSMDFIRTSGDAIIMALNLKETDRVLDIASGTGEPALTVAEIVRRGDVTATDLSEGMLVVADEKAAARGVKNFRTMVCDVTDLPFADSTFDAVSCRFGFMFFPDMQRAANEVARVLKPSGRVVTTVWGPAEKNFWITAIMSSIRKYVELPPVPADAPGILRCARAGIVSELFTNAGLKHAFEREIAGKYDYGTFDRYWSFMTEVVAPVVSTMASASAETIAKIKQDTFDAVLAKNSDGRARFEYSSTAISAEK